MSFYAVVEIAPDSNGALPSHLLTAAYRASREATVLLVLNGVSVASVDQLLDPIVRREGVAVRGVVYATVEDATVMLAARTAPVVLASSSLLRTQFRALGIAALAPDAGSLILAPEASDV
jgi:hypothetical protein